MDEVAAAYEDIVVAHLAIPAPIPRPPALLRHLVTKTLTKCRKSARAGRHPDATRDPG